MLIVEEALRNREGHWFEYNRATKAAVQGGSDVEVDMLGHTTMESAVADELVARPHFRFTVWDQIYNHPQAVRRYLGIGLHNYRLYQDLSAYLKQAEYYDTVFAPTVVLHHLLGYHAIARQYAGQKFGQLVLLIRNNIALYDGDGNRTFRRTAGIWKKAIQRFAPLLKRGVVNFVTDSERLADEYEELTGLRFEVLPHPSLVGLTTSSETQSIKTHAANPIRLFLPGPARHEKGVVRLLEAARILRDADLSRPFEITLQWRDSFPLPSSEMIGPDDVTTFASENVAFRVIREPLSSEAYLNEMQNADAIILPYRREVYYARISGVAVEAMMLGIPLLFTANTWVDSVCSEFDLGQPMEDNAASVAQALEKLPGSLEGLSNDASQKKFDVASYFSADLFRSRLLKAA